MDKLFTILIRKDNDTEATVFDYTQDVVRWQELPLGQVAMNVLAALAQGYVAVPGDTPQPLGTEIHIVRKGTYNQVIARQERIR